ncbi:Histone-lysine N-methyltransferase SETMAR [Eumeta japonica]|uniref:Histone-lysine N-methyltransferase SETMAR n=1 Tax=Eumeta variegata TaxID=151549 RepID=A0A4C1ZGG6_EUMVA|nr:Histone-lysine N-methyltransferase SETMAR [Eumeta japonica]
MRIKVPGARAGTKEGGGVTSAGGPGEERPHAALHGAAHATGRSTLYLSVTTLSISLSSASLFPFESTGHMNSEKQKVLITADEKWNTYDKNVRNISWSKGKQGPQGMAKYGLARNKLTPSICWNWKDIIHYKLLPACKTLSSDFYCQQLRRLKQKVEEKRPELI